MTEDEKYVREQCVNVELHDDIAPEVWCDGEVYGSATYDKGDTEEEAWANAANTVRTRLQQIRDVEEEIALLSGVETTTKAFISSIYVAGHIKQDAAKETPIWKRILAREQAALADLKRGLRVAE